MPKKKEKIQLDNQTDVFIVRTSISPGSPINVYYSSMRTLWNQDTGLADLLSSEGPWPVEKPFYLEDHGGYEMIIWITKERPYGLIVPTGDPADIEKIFKAAISEAREVHGWLDREVLETNFTKEYVDANVYRLAAETGNALDEEDDGWHVYGTE